MDGAVSRSDTTLLALVAVAGFGGLGFLVVMWCIPECGPSIGCTQPGGKGNRL
jgi:nitrate reductase NapE component